MDLHNALLALAIVGMAASCSSASTCSIKGTIDTRVDSVYLMKGGSERLDAAAVKNGSFSLSCALDPTLGVSIMTGPDSDPVSLVPDSKEILVRIENGAISVSGSPLSQELQTLEQWMLNHFMSHNERAMALIDAGDPEGADTLMQDMHKTMADHCKEVYLKHLNDPVGVQAMVVLRLELPEDEYKQLYEQGGASIHDDPMLNGQFECRPDGQ